MTRADNGILPLGRSRDTGVGAATLPPSTPTPIKPRTRVTLRLWGETDADVLDAERNARDSVLAAFWDIIDVIATRGGACPIRRNDPIALGQAADYGQAWAAYWTAAA